MFGSSLPTSKAMPGFIRISVPMVLLLGLLSIPQASAKTIAHVETYTSGDDAGPVSSQCQKTSDSFAHCVGFLGAFAEATASAELVRLEGSAYASRSPRLSDPGSSFALFYAESSGFFIAQGATGTAMMDLNIDFENPSSPALDSAEYIFKFGDSTHTGWVPQEFENPSIQLKIPITFGQQIPFYARLGAQFPDTGGWNGSMSFGPVGFLDPTGEPVWTATYRFIDDVPEPGTAGLFALGILLVVSAKRVYRRP